MDSIMLVLIKVLPLLLCKMEKKRVLVILIALNWPRRLWYIDIKRSPPILSFFLVTGFNGMAVDTHRSIYDSIIPTFLGERKSSSRRIHHHMWKAYFAWCKDKTLSPREYSLTCILAFVQSGLDDHLALCTLRDRFLLYPFYYKNLLPSQDFSSGSSYKSPKSTPCSPCDLFTSETFLSTNYSYSLVRLLM